MNTYTIKPPKDLVQITEPGEPCGPNCEGCPENIDKSCIESTTIPWFDDKPSVKSWDKSDIVEIDCGSTAYHAVSYPGNFACFIMKGYWELDEASGKAIFVNREPLYRYKDIADMRSRLSPEKKFMMREVQKCKHILNGKICCVCLSGVVVPQTSKDTSKLHHMFMKWQLAYGDEIYKRFKELMEESS